MNLRPRDSLSIPSMCAFRHHPDTLPVVAER